MTKITKMVIQIVPDFTPPYKENEEQLFKENTFITGRILELG